MNDFFSDQLGEALEWFGLTHILLIVGFLLTVALLWVLSPRIRGSRHEPWFRYGIIALAFLFEWKVFESRMLEASPFRMPLCAVALYALTYAVAFKKERVFRIVYFYAFGSLLSFLFFDTAWGLDRWNGWTFFGAHAVIAWLAVYGYRVLGFAPVRRDLNLAMLCLAMYAAVSGYAYDRFGGSDELFLFNPPVDFLYVLKDIHEVVYLAAFSLFVVILMFAMYLPVHLSEKTKKI